MESGTATFISDFPKLTRTQFLKLYRTSCNNNHNALSGRGYIPRFFLYVSRETFIKEIMIFTVKKASDLEYKRYIHINSLEELKNFVLSFDCKACVIYWDDMELLIYDDWIE